MLDAKSDGTISHPSAVKALARDVDTLHEMLRDNPTIRPAASRSAIWSSG
jgi:hypothetical protein